VCRKKCTCNQHEDYSGECCDTFKLFLNDCRVGLIYDRRTRDFGIRRPYGSGSHGISHCPWCGTMLPLDLIDKWEEVLKKEYGISDPWSSQQEKLIPAEFQTDEWWKKRGL
jgi:hypothetical protein